MSATGLDVFDRTIQNTNIWLDEIMDRLGPDRQLAWKVLTTVLHQLRDRLPTNFSAHLAAQLPLLVRGVYYDQYEPSVQPIRPATGEDFIHEVDKWLADARPVDPKEAIAAVFAVLTHHLDRGMIEKTRHALPAGIRDLWRVPVGAEAE